MKKIIWITIFTLICFSCAEDSEPKPSNATALDTTSPPKPLPSVNFCNLQNSSMDYEWINAKITDSLGNSRNNFLRGENFIMSYNLSNHSSNDTLCYVFNTEAFPITYEIRNNNDSLVSRDWSHTCIVVTGAVGSTTILPNSSRTYSIEYYPELGFDICADTLDAGNYTVKINSGSSYQGIQAQEFSITIEE